MDGDKCIKPQNKITKFEYNELSLMMMILCESTISPNSLEKDSLK